MSSLPGRWQTASTCHHSRCWVPSSAMATAHPGRRIRRHNQLQQHDQTDHESVQGTGCCSLLDFDHTKPSALDGLPRRGCRGRCGSTSPSTQRSRLSNSPLTCLTEVDRLRSAPPHRSDADRPATQAWSAMAGCRSAFSGPPEKGELTGLGEQVAVGRPQLAVLVPVALAGEAGSESSQDRSGG
jgi:hypothetical protein